MQEQNSPLVSTPVAILAGSLLVSLSILISSGVISIRGFKAVKNTNTPQSADLKAADPTAPAPFDRDKQLDNLVKLAKNVGVDTSKFRACVDEEKYKNEISKDLTDAQNAGADGTPTFFIGKTTSDEKIEGIRVVGAQPINVFKTIIDDQLSGALKPATASAELVAVSIDDDPILGNKSAPITMVEFSDYECPFCKRYFEQTFPEIVKQYVDTGKLRIVFRDLPLSFHEPAASLEANAANCVREQKDDKAYFEMHNEIFKATASNGTGV